MLFAIFFVLFYQFISARTRMVLQKIKNAQKSGIFFVGKAFGKSFPHIPFQTLHPFLSFAQTKRVAVGTKHGYASPLFKEF